MSVINESKGHALVGEETRNAVVIDSLDRCDIDARRTHTARSLPTSRRAYRPSKNNYLTSAVLVSARHQFRQENTLRAARPRFEEMSISRKLDPV